MRAVLGEGDGARPAGVQKGPGLGRRRTVQVGGAAEASLVGALGRTSRARPSSSAGPLTTRAGATVPPEVAAERAARNTARSGVTVRTGVTRMSRTPPQVRPTAKASSSL
ncbi:hypothetical protein [Streptomyces cyaneofuscatus]|uniref:hypothetical protein n=1 Tax=Streptomyces cyaneofuscatus TaxID=66883 RepID=UPI00365790BE